MAKEEASKTEKEEEDSVSTEQVEVGAAKRLSFTQLSKDEETELVKVYLRIRPDHREKDNEDDAGGFDGFADKESDTVKAISETTVQTVPPEESQAFKNRELGGKYTFTKIYNKKSQQDEVFKDTTLPLVTSFVKDRKDGLLFAYGVTNAGKTYTVEGTEENPGIIPRTLEKVFSLLKETDPENTKHVEVSYLQVYNEQVHDLQVAGRNASYNSQKKRLQLKLREEGVEVEGLKRTKVSSCDEGLDVLRRGREQRTTHETLLNVSSSRSHSVFIINILENTGKSNGARLYIVDLAGTERGKRTQTTRAQQREASNINCSLMNLMRCLDTIRHNQKQRHLNKGQKLVPFRQSKLTMLFRDCLVGGNSGGVVMVVNASARPADYDETAHALKYGALAKHVSVMTSKVSSRQSSVQYGYNGRRVGDNDRKQSSVFATPRASLSTSRQVVCTPEENHQLNQMSWNELRQALFEARSRCVTMEAEIREEVGREMSERLSQMESVFRKRVEAAKQISDSKSESMLGNLRKRMQGGSNVYTMKDIEELVQNIIECEEEMERMRALHAMDVDILKKEVRALKQNQQPDFDNSKKTKPSPAVQDEITLLYKASPLNTGVNFDHVGQLEILQDELREERDLHDKTNRQLIEATQLAQSAMDGESEARKEVKLLKQKLERLQAQSHSKASKRKSDGTKKTQHSKKAKDSPRVAINVNENANRMNHSSATQLVPKKKTQAGGGLISRMVGRLVAHNNSRRNEPMPNANPKTDTPIARRTRSSKVVNRGL